VRTVVQVIDTIFLEAKVDEMSFVVVRSQQQQKCYYRLSPLAKMGSYFVWRTGLWNQDRRFVVLEIAFTLQQMTGERDDEMKDEEDAESAYHPKLISIPLSFERSENVKKLCEKPFEEMRCTPFTSYF
jgi:hypothetical protein